MDLRSHGLPGARNAYAMAGNAVQLLLCHGIAGDGEYGTVQFHRGNLPIYVWEPPGGGGSNPDRHRLSRDFWRNRPDRHGIRTAGSHFSRDLHAVFHGGHHVVLRPDPRYFRLDFSRCAEAWSGCIRGCGIWNLQEPSVWYVQRRVLQ